MREKCVYLSRGQRTYFFILHLERAARPKRLKIVKAEALGNTFFIIGNGQVFGFFRRVRVLLLVLGFALQLALGFFGLFLLPLPLFLSFCEGGTRASSHEHS